MSIALPATEVLFRSEFYVTGGTLRPDAPSYVERQADKELCQGLLNGEFCYVLTSRQMGKSSLMVRTVRRLREEGVAVAVLDLTAIGQNLTIEQWYDGLVSRLGQQLKLEDQLLAFWETHADWGPLQRWTSALENVVLKQISGEVVIFVDEIDIVRSLPFSTDEFFAGIRECYNRRAHEPAFNRLAFGLLGVAAPTDLIRDTRMTPFNVGRRIELHDFTPLEAAPLARGLGADEESAKELLSRVLHWTGGHPYLTQRLCRALAESITATQQANAAATPGLPPVLPTPKDVDQLAEKLFLSRQARDRDDNLVFVRERLLRSELDVPGLLLLYRRIHIGELVTNDETNPLITILHLSGIARGVNGYLQVRNRIYRQVFDLAWIQTNMPAAEVRRQRRAGRRGMLLGFGTAGVLLAGYLVFGPIWSRYREANLARQTAQRLQSTYLGLKAYRDSFETSLDIGLGGSTVSVRGSGSLIYEEPDKVNLALKSQLTSPEIEVRLLRNGNQSLLYAPALQQFQVLTVRRGRDRPEPPPPPPMPPRGRFELPPRTARDLGPISVLPLYRLLLDPGAAQRFLEDAREIQPMGYEEIDGQPTRKVRWQHDARAFLSRLEFPPPASGEAQIPVTAWVNTSNHLILQIQVDLSNWAGRLLNHLNDTPITSLVITEVHRFIQTRNTGEASSAPFRLDVTGDVRPVDQLDLPPPNLAILSSPQRSFAKNIPPRPSFTPTNLVDLSDYYNAAFTETWHPGTPRNTLEMLPRGLLQLDGTLFDVRGIVQLSGKELQNAGGRYPRQISGIRIAQTCRLLHFIHGAGWSARDGTRVGTYLVRYANGSEQPIPIVYGEDLRDWNAGGDDSSKVSRARIVWRAVNDARFSVRLFKTTWINPAPELEIASIDFSSAMSESAPFLLAITADQ